jgi:curved DNA-binding protein CbpA
MDNYYSLLGLNKDASIQDIKKAFREKAKLLHPDIAGKDAEANMRRLLAAYQVLSNSRRRYEYDRAYGRFIGKSNFDYRNFLKEQNDNESLSKLVFFDFLHLEDDEAIEIWTDCGGLDFYMKNYLDREDWMDCSFVLAEELDRRGRSFEACILLTALVKEENRKPYFRHFTEDVVALLCGIVKTRLKASTNRENYVSCLETLLSMNYFPARERKRWLQSLTAVLQDIPAELTEKHSS